VDRKEATSSGLKSCHTTTDRSTTYGPRGPQNRIVQIDEVGTSFLVNLVLCHIEVDKDRSTKAAAIGRLAHVYHYFENLTGNRGITLLLAGGLTDVPEQASESLISQGEMVPLRTNLAAAEGRHDQGQRMFASAGLRVLIEESGLGTSTPPSPMSLWAQANRFELPSIKRSKFRSCRSGVLVSSPRAADSPSYGRAAVPVLVSLPWPGPAVPPSAPRSRHGRF